MSDDRAVFRPELRRIDEPGMPAYVRVDPSPRVGVAGLCIRVRILASAAGLAAGASQVALANAEHATGWSIGVDAVGRPSLIAGTASGPAVLRLGERLEPERWYDFVARIPGAASDRLELAVQEESPTPGQAGGSDASVRIGSPVLNSTGPLLWGCRSLYDGVRPELPFAGRVADVLIVADACAEGSSADQASEGTRSIGWELDAAVG